MTVDVFIGGSISDNIPQLLTYAALRVKAFMEEQVESTLVGSLNRVRLRGNMYLTVI